MEIPADAKIYLCGPPPFMEAVHLSLIQRHISEADIRYEIFGPDKWLASA